MNNTDAKSILFSELASSFLSEKKIRCRESTSDGYDIILRTHILPYFKNLYLHEIKPYTVRLWQNELLSKKLKDRYVRRIDTLLVSIFNYGVRFFDIPNNPAVLAGPIGVKPEKIVHFWTLSEYKQFISLVDSTTLRIIFNILYWTGMRIGELLALTKDDIMLEDGYISISKTFRLSKGKKWFSPPKTTKGHRDIYIHNELLKEFRDYIATLPQNTPPERIYLSTSNKTWHCESNVLELTRLFPFTAEYIRYQLYKYTKKANLNQIRVHDLRHSHASLLIELNVSPLLISERLGHEKVETTLSIYSHLYPNKQKQLTVLLDNINDIQ